MKLLNLNLLVLIVAVSLASPAIACLWDYDTLEQEAQGLPDIAMVIAGGFPRNPSLYYEMRLKRQTEVLEKEADNFDAYDDVAVACERLGKTDDAINWMEKKKAAMDRAGYEVGDQNQPDHWYRYFANLGTFYAIDGLRQVVTSRT